jgi:hypothetical protein
MYKIGHKTNRCTVTEKNANQVDAVLVPSVPMDWEMRCLAKVMLSLRNEAFQISILLPLQKFICKMPPLLGLCEFLLVK